MIYRCPINSQWTSTRFKSQTRVVIKTLSLITVAVYDITESDDPVERITVAVGRARRDESRNGAIGREVGIGLEAEIGREVAIGLEAERGVGLVIESMILGGVVVGREATE